MPPVRKQGVRAAARTTHLRTDGVLPPDIATAMQRCDKANLRPMHDWVTMGPNLEELAVPSNPAGGPVWTLHTQETHTAFRDREQGSVRVTLRK